MADITVWAVMFSHTVLRAFAHGTEHTHARAHTHLLISSTEQDSMAEREGSDTELLYLNHHGYLSPSLSVTHTHMHTHAALILADRNTDVSKP